jgi:excisionase family DNA binding protein
MKREALLNTADLALYLKMGVRGARTILNRGEIKGAVKIGNEWRVNPDAVDEWLRQKGLHV